MKKDKTILAAMTMLVGIAVASRSSFASNGPDRYQATEYHPPLVMAAVVTVTYALSLRTGCKM